MKLKTLVTDDNAVSPVIGVILMVAITVILAAVIGTFVLGLGGQVGNNAPSANIGFDYNNISTSVGGDVVNASHNGGDPLQTKNLKMKIGGTLVWDAGSYDNNAASAPGASDWDGKVTAGDLLTIYEDSNKIFTDGDDVQLIWESSEGGDTAIIGDGTVSL